LLYWRSRCNRGHVPWKVKGQLRRLIIQMYNENAGWGAERIQGELLKLGYNVTKPIIAKAPSKIKDQLGRLILHMYNENTGWGVARIHAELLKLGYSLNRGTVARYLFRHFGTHPLTQARGWKIFLRNHMHDAAAIDMFVVISMSFRLLYAMVVIRLDRRTILHIDTTERPTQDWLANGISRAFTENPKPRYLIRDRDACYGQKFCQRLKELGISQHLIPRQTPWANIFVERIIYSIRRECLNHVIILNEQHLRRILGEYVEYYNRSRTHRSLGQDCPISRPAQTLSEGNCIISISASRRPSSSLRTTQKLCGGLRKSR
jgi:transposase InsO family protein